MRGSVNGGHAPEAYEGVEVPSTIQELTDACCSAVKLLVVIG